MKKGLKKIVGWKPSVSVISVVYLFLLVITVIPLLRLAPYAIPWYDDYAYGLNAYENIQMGKGFLGALQGAYECARTSWYAWQGTVTSAYIMALVPSIWGEEYYFIGPVFLILALALSVFLFVGVVFRYLFGCKETLALQAITSTMVLMLIYTAKSAFYWFNGGMHYVGTHSFFLCYVAILIYLIKSDNRRATVFWVIVSAFMGFMTGGGNYVTTLQAPVLTFSIIGACILLQNKRWVLLLPAAVCNLGSVLFNALAPGNDKRIDSFGGWRYSAIGSILRSFQEAFRFIPEFTGMITLAILILLVPLLWYMARRSRIAFRFPWLVTVWSFCVYATGFTPSLFSLGHAGLSRTLNVVKITFQILLIINEFYWIGALERLLQKKGKTLWDGICHWWFYPFMGGVMLLLFLFAPNQAGNYSAYGAYYYRHTGEAYNFYQEYLQRVELLQSDQKEIVVKPYVYQPWFLWMGDIEDEKDAETNQVMAEWYRKDWVICDYGDIY